VGSQRRSVAGFVGRPLARSVNRRSSSSFV